MPEQTAFTVAGELGLIRRLQIGVAHWPGWVLRNEANAALARYQERKRAKLQAANDLADGQPDGRADNA